MESKSEEHKSIDDFDPLKPSIPISYPLKTLESLQSLESYFNSFHFPFNKSSVPLPSSSLPDRPRLLVCHDMAGGYVDDKFVQGGSNEGAYSFWHWYLIDVFVYFSHNLVTIPPPCWINAAHTHGVKVLGTFITEWDQGKAICDTLLSTKDSALMYAERLTELAVALGFDGWLVNMEIQLDVALIPNLKEFVNHLTQTMHSSMPGSVIIWYDSVTIDGDLSWQNQLNQSNKPFFDLCDGIFVNYTWKEDNPKLSATVAGDRKFDVYMGIDVFGRNTYGGGEWTTNVALDVLKKDNVSAAIFAPGWVYETKQPPDFKTAQNRWWGLIEKSWELNRYYPKLLPFYSNFDQGHGYHFSVNGRQVSNDPWCNISCQNFQPVLENSFGPLPDTIQFAVDFKDASFSGGGNLKFQGTLEEGCYFTARLFRGQLPLDDLPIHITYSMKRVGRSMLGLALEFSSENNKRASVLIAHQYMNNLARKFDKVVVPHDSATESAGWIVQESSISMKGYILTEIRVMCFLMSTRELQAPRIGTPQSVATDFSASLGHISITATGQNSEFPPASSWEVEGQDIEWSPDAKMLSIKLVWSMKGGYAKYFPSYNVYARKQVKKGVGVIEQVEEHIGVAKVRAFYISNYVVPREILSLKFIIQVCGLDGTCQKLDSSPELVLTQPDL
ncbi:mannosyl-glycoprotein endo-beta-N-acetylglucosaminidase [Ranunculus cassubicifolius]